jgi:hypothetical protein
MGQCRLPKIGKGMMKSEAPGYAAAACSFSCGLRSLDSPTTTMNVSSRAESGWAT